ncbi:nuclease-related domain-containing protein [Heyndrickxia ginsengihumi]|nr:nuclease-related domain-containing protein [Heyndrickxia ginsengihumi]MCM3024688.1 NERD domain-containing protein [Heyndrickxia ginsengihumi]
MIFISSFIILMIAPASLFIMGDKAKFEKSTYKKETANSYWKVRWDKGLNGEYLTVNELDKMKQHFKVLINIYLPNRRGGTSEIDVVLLHRTGIYVLESKNYSGWIFGREEDKKWCQSLPNGKKTFFYNPIKQNETHIRALQQALPDVDQSLFRSIIVFSERCELKKIQLQSLDIKVLKRNKLRNYLKMNKGKQLSVKEMETIYQQLKSYTNVPSQLRIRHIEEIRQRYKVK